LRISETDLVGGRHLSSDRLQSDPHMAIPPLRVALQTNGLKRRGWRLRRQALPRG
jgi:hypothetical protein